MAPDFFTLRPVVRYRVGDMMPKGRTGRGVCFVENIREEVVVDGRGESYILPSRLRVADCSICKRLVVRDRERAPLHIRRSIGYIGGWKKQFDDHSRPVCLKCWNATMTIQKS